MPPSSSGIPIPALGLTLLCALALAEETSVASNPISIAALPAVACDLLLPGDLLHIEVYDNPDLSIDVRVPSDGAVQLPLVGQCDGLRRMSSDELARRLRQQLEARFLNRALVTVTVKEYAPRRAYVMGGVAKPGAIILGPAQAATAIRAISEAGGLVDDADHRNIVVLREDGQGGATALPVQVADPGGHLADVVLRPNDLIMVSRLDRIFITGQVKQPGSVPSNQPNLTVARALSLAGGFDKYARGSQVQLLRSGQPAREVDVEKILAGDDEDLLLLPGDMLNVPERRF